MKELLTGDNKERFEEWVHYNICDGANIKRPYEIYDYPFEMQLGIFLSYYDSVGLQILPHKSNVLSWWYFEINEQDYNEDPFKSRNEAYKAAFIKANEILNKEI